ncbi:MAG TPA: serine/threonine-protein kinase [Acidimicrobiales bacterium]|nr:serine/threonine-protein kinase [Acidimicrobiales bacterium]
MSDRDEILAALPEYDIGGELGRGGFGVVLAGRHRQLRRDVAIKELPPALAADPRVRARFAAEARVLASLSHPHIVPIYDYVERDGICLLVMEKLPGGTLWERFRQQGLGVETTCAVVMAACTALHYAHRRGVLHRDVKPENLLYSADGVLKITDFGIAKVVGGGETLATRGGEILGTPAYMAPEQAEGRELGPEADVYATGIMLYELLSGALPYPEDGGPLAIVYRHVYEDPTPISQAAPGLVPALMDVTMRAIARAPGDRYPTAEAFGVAIGEAVTPAWGPAWLDRAGMQIVDAGPVSESAKRPTGGTAGAAAPPAPPSAAPPRAAGGSTIVRPKVDDHVVGGSDVAVGGADLVPIRQVIELPGPPYALAATALVLFLLAFAAALIGIGKATITKSLPPGTATVAGVDPTTSATIKLDLSKPIPVTVSKPPAGVTAVQVGLSVAGVPLPPTTTEPLANGSAAPSATTDRYLAGGTVTGDLRLIGAGGTTLGHQPFLAKGKQPAFLTVPGGLIVALFLFFVAYIESLLRPLRLGQRGVGGAIGVAIFGAGLGVSIVGLTWLLGSPEPSPTTIIVCAICGAAAGVAAALAALRMAQRARFKPRASAQPAGAGGAPGAAATRKL